MKSEKFTIWANEQVVEISRVNNVDIMPIKIALADVDAFCSLLYQARAKGYVWKLKKLKDNVDQAELNLEAAKKAYEAFINNTKPDQ